ncbi:MAG: GGDEF domain-containing protein [Rhodoferax sp.]|nr:GGDEF domain-containing protein [Rhodoferax sp.]
MTLDIATLLLSTLINALLMMTALWSCVVLRGAPGLRSWIHSLACQAAGFAFLIVAASVAPRMTASIGVFLLSLSISYMQLATARFTGSTLWERGRVAPAFALGVMHWLVYDNTQWAVALTNLVIGVQTLVAAYALLKGASASRWRWLVGSVALINGMLIMARAYLVVFHFGNYPAFIEPHPLNIAGMLMLNASLVLGTIGYLLAHRDEAEQALQQLASVDSLTGLHNRRVWMERSEAALQHTKAHRGHILVMLDLDHFKKINDTRGHPVGDKVLRLVGSTIKVALRRDDIAGRYGGEEYCILLSDCTGEDFVVFDARLHQQLSDWSQSELGFEVCFSAGAVICKPGLSLADAIAKADEALYRAKGRGRNQTCFVN